MSRVMLCTIFFTLLAWMAPVSASSGSSSSPYSAQMKQDRYDKLINVWSPGGELLQVNYAEQAGRKGLPVVCLKAKDGDEDIVVLCCARTSHSSLLDRRSVDKVSKVDEKGEIWVAFSGLAGDGNALVRLSRKICSNYRLQYGASPTVQYLARSIGEIQHDFTLKGTERPFGVQMLFFGYGQDLDDDVTSTPSSSSGSESRKARDARGVRYGFPPSVFLSRPSGHVSEWGAAALGTGADKVMHVLEEALKKKKRDDLTDQTDLTLSNRVRPVLDKEAAIRLAISSMGLNLDLPGININNIASKQVSGSKAQEEEGDKEEEEIKGNNGAKVDVYVLRPYKTEMNNTDTQTGTGNGGEGRGFLRRYLGVRSYEEVIAKDRRIDEKGV